MEDTHSERLSRATGASGLKTKTTARQLDGQFLFLTLFSYSDLTASSIVLVASW